MPRIREHFAQLSDFERRRIIGITETRLSLDDIAHHIVRKRKWC